MNRKSDNQLFFNKRDALIFTAGMIAGGILYRKIQQSNICTVLSQLSDIVLSNKDLSNKNKNKDIKSEILDL